MSEPGLHFCTFAGSAGLKTCEMKIKRLIFYLLPIVFFTITPFLSSCKSRKSICDANRVYQPKKLKKNKSNYGSKYNYKGKPVRKDYVLRNGR